MSPPLVTIVALCYNHERFVEQCLDSIRAQTFRDYELIVVDDASADGSRTRIARWLAEHRPDATFIAQAENRGVCGVLNLALAAARGRYFALVATDDLWEPEKLDRHVAALSREPDDVAVAYSDAIRIDVDGNPLQGDFIETYRPGLVPPSGDVLGDLTTANFIPAMSTLVRVDALRAVGGYDETLSFEDYDMWLRLATRYSFVFVPGKLARYRIVPGSLIHALQAGRRRGHAVTYCRMALKHVREARLSPELRALWEARLVESGRELFVMGAPEAAHYLRVAARIVHTPRVLLLAAAATAAPRSAYYAKAARAKAVAAAKRAGVSRARLHAVRRTLRGARPGASSHT